MEEKEIKIDLKPEVAKGSYSNLAIITHSHIEFIIDLGTISSGPVYSMFSIIGAPAVTPVLSKIPGPSPI